MNAKVPNGLTALDSTQFLLYLSGAMDAFDQELRDLVAQACQCPVGSLERQKKTTIVVRQVIKSGKLWKDSAPYYRDILQKTWIYFCLNLCEAVTVEQPYCPTRASVMTWLNSYLKWELHKARENLQTNTKRTASPRMIEPGEFLDPMDFLEAPPDVPPILEITRQWAEADVDEELRRVHMQSYPHITCQLLILRRLPPETGWKELSEEFDLPISALSSFYQRHCQPKLRKFGSEQGWLLETKTKREAKLQTRT